MMKLLWRRRSINRARVNGDVEEVRVRSFFGEEWFLFYL